jgi:hypothetical protein
VLWKGDVSEEDALALGGIRGSNLEVLLSEPLDLVRMNTAPLWLVEAILSACV